MHVCVDECLYTRNLPRIYFLLETVCCENGVFQIIDYFSRRNVLYYKRLRVVWRQTAKRRQSGYKNCVTC